MPSCPPVGPGPGAYGLPPEVGFPCHDVRKPRLPMYSFGQRTPLYSANKGPGPCYKIEGVSRYGKDTVPMFSLKSRSTLPEKSTGPGPAAYSPKLKDNAPAFSMRGRINVPTVSVGPGPCAYSLPGTINDLAFSITSRRDSTEVWKSPGPATYYLGNPDVYKHRNGSFSLTSRTKEYSTFKSPGPAAYYAKTHPGSKGPYSFSFGSRHNPCSMPYITPDDLAQ
ncbi:outer dense fiber protein 3B-like [Ctenocephalides felis]|uniref:outer dense fiber protein 3B-like n=1 Tax=Ctenocephalides felis TaxID=7515 RepID=UPI000E6E3579|nr:outer dense fiber protein 3B-like [Ctenocephalides felis]